MISLAYSIRVFLHTPATARSWRLDAEVLVRATSDRRTADPIMGDFGYDSGRAGYREGLEFHEKTHSSQLSRTMAIRMVSTGRAILVGSHNDQTNENAPRSRIPSRGRSP